MRRSDIHRHRHAARVVRLPVRRGLAPLELVLSLPILLFVMALMMIFGTAGAWKVRTMANSREAAFRAVQPRTGNRDANPLGWPKNAEMSFNQARQSLMPNDPFAQHQVVRGPVLSDGGGGNSIRVRTQQLDMTFGVYHGHSRVERPFPLFAVMPPHKIDFPRETVIVDGTLWQFWNMGVPENLERRIPSLYDFQFQMREPDLCAAYYQAALQISQNPRRIELSPLEGNDPEMAQLVPEISPNFVRAYRISEKETNCQEPQDPPQCAYCSQIDNCDYCKLSSEQVRSERIDGENGYLRRIERDLPRSMADHYIGRYTQVKQRLEAQMMALQNVQPPATPDAQQIAGLQSQIDDLQKKIDQLNQFKASIPM